MLGEAPNKYTTAGEALKDLRAKDPKVNDQYYPPWVVVDDAGKSVGTIEDGDAVVIWNFRADRVVSASSYSSLLGFVREVRGLPESRVLQNQSKVIWLLSSESGDH